MDGNRLQSIGVVALWPLMTTASLDLLHSFVTAVKLVLIDRVLSLNEPWAFSHSLHNCDQKNGSIVEVCMRCGYSFTLLYMFHFIHLHLLQSPFYGPRTMYANYCGAPLTMLGACPCMLMSAFSSKSSCELSRITQVATEHQVGLLSKIIQILREASTAKVYEHFLFCSTTVDCKNILFPVFEKTVYF